jgi:hypothetical protein
MTTHRDSEDRPSGSGEITGGARSVLDGTEFAYMPLLTIDPVDLVLALVIFVAELSVAVVVLTRE